MPIQSSATCSTTKYLGVALFSFFLCGLMMAGCAGEKLRSVTPPQFLSVPFFPTKTDQCGPSALASVLAFWKSPADIEGLKREIYITRLKGTLSMDMLLAAESHGLKASVYEGSLDDLRLQVKKGYPPILFVNLGYDLFPIGHYIVVTGFDDGRGGVFAHSGSTPNKFISYKQLLRSWNKTDRWTLLAVPSGKS